MKNFELGRIVYTKGIGELIKQVGIEELRKCVVMHSQCDWGELCEEDKQANDDAVKNGDRILSAYKVGKDKIKIWIITEFDRSYTTILLPEEY